MLREGELQELQAQIDSLTAQNLKLKEEIWLLKKPSEAVANVDHISKILGSLSISPHGRARYHGDSSSSDILRELLPDEAPQVFRYHALGLSEEITELVDAFPFGVTDCPYTATVFLPYFPDYDTAIQLANLYYKISTWMQEPVSQDEFFDTILKRIYAAPTTPDFEVLNAYHLSIFFTIMAHGSLYNSNDPQHLVNMAKYHALGLAAFSLDRLDLGATCATVQALLVHILFRFQSDRKSNEERWLMMGVCARVIHSLGIHRERPEWNLHPVEQQRRRRVAWEFYTRDLWTSIANGRPPTIMLDQTDTAFPDALDSTDEYHRCKYRFISECLWKSVQHIFVLKESSYTRVLEIDETIRSFSIPPDLQVPDEKMALQPWSLDPQRALHQYALLCMRESNLLYLHRSYFIRAIQENPADPLTHKFSPSVIAAFTSSCRLVCSLKRLYSSHSEVVSRTWFIWSSTFSACIVLVALVVKSPRCTLSSTALAELEQAAILFEKGSRPSCPARIREILSDVLRRAKAAYHHGSQPVPAVLDNLEVLVGHKSVIPVSDSPLDFLPGEGIVPFSSDSAEQGESWVQFLKSLGLDLN